MRILRITFILYLSTILFGISVYAKTILRSNGLSELLVQIQIHPQYKETMKFMKLPFEIKDRKIHRLGLQQEFELKDIKYKKGKSLLGRAIFFTLFGVYESSPGVNLISY